MRPLLKINFLFLAGLRFQLIRAEGEEILAEGGAALWQGKTNLLAGEVTPEEITGSAGKELAGKEHAGKEHRESVVTDLGTAQRWSVRALIRTRGSQLIRQTITVDQYPQWSGETNFPAFVLQWSFENLSDSPLAFDRLECPALHLGGWIRGKRRRSEPAWTFQGAAVQWGQDFAFALPEVFQRENYLGHADNGEGGGIPLVYFWNRAQGLALAHLAPQPKDWFLPVVADRQGVKAALESRQAGCLQPGETLTSLRTLLSLHEGDFFAPLALYREILSAQGLRPAQPNPEDYEPAWCSWGYEFDVRPEEMTGVLPALKDLADKEPEGAHNHPGVHWLTLDDRWFDRYGDWNPRHDTFEGGAEKMRQMVDEIHTAEAYAQIWWYPLAVEDGSGHWEKLNYGIAETLRQHPEWLILNQNDTPARNNRRLAILCPALPEVQEYIRQLTLRFIQDWGFDGHKLDNIYTVPACHNPAHHHARPEESTEALAAAYRIIFETTRALKPHSVTQICSCGTPPTFSLLPYMDQAVTADPTSSAQIRQRIKFYKALLGPHAAVFADHIELSDGGLDFASEIGAGGVPSTKFIWPEEPGLRHRLHDWWPLTAEKQEIFRHWLSIYRQHHLADGAYLNLYDLAFDRPEAHAIRQGEKLYYAFYAGGLRDPYHGLVTLRGLEPCTYRVYDYGNQMDLGIVNGPEAVLEVDFVGAILLVTNPE